MRRTRLPPGQMERWDTPDHDFLDVFRVPAAATAPRLLLLHGLEGSPQSHYARGMLQRVARAGWGAEALVFRGCGAELNRTPRFYHSGETGDLELLAHRVAAEFPYAPLLAVGYSLGGNVLLKWLGDPAARRPATLQAAAAVSVPYDLEAGAHYLQHGLSRVYERRFLRTLKSKATRKLRRFPDAYDLRALTAARTLVQFDDAVTAPLHGFANAHDYYTQCSARQFLAGVQLPTLLISAYDDPFLPAAVLRDVDTVAGRNPAFTRLFSATGGHVGFVAGADPLHPGYYSEDRVFEFLAAQVSPFTPA
ncbi:MAG TPA: alpha/beta fold hydrolase [Gemmatimonadaceae bacterium]|nr:alpha/beta fold hydrolase [Gemmatimonadaceae bacterium]